MPLKKRITLRDVLAHIQGMRQSLEKHLDGVEHRLDGVEHRLGSLETTVERIDQRLTRMETSLVPSHQRLQVTVRAHAGRLRRLEKKTGLVSV